MATKKKRARRRAKAAMKRTNHTWLTMYDCNSLPNVPELFDEVDADIIMIGDPDVTSDFEERYPVCLDVEDSNGVKLNILLGRCRSLEDGLFDVAVCYEGKRPKLREMLLIEMVDDYDIIGKNKFWDEWYSRAGLRRIDCWEAPGKEYEEEDDLMDDPEMAAYETIGA